MGADLLGEVSPQLGLERVLQDGVLGIAPGLEYLRWFGPSVEFQDAACFNLLLGRCGMVGSQLAECLVGAHQTFWPVG